MKFAIMMSLAIASAIFTLALEMQASLTCAVGALVIFALRGERHDQPD